MQTEFSTKHEINWCMAFPISKQGWSHLILEVLGLSRFGTWGSGSFVWFMYKWYVCMIRAFVNTVTVYLRHGFEERDSVTWMHIAMRQKLRWVGWDSFECRVPQAVTKASDIKCESKSWSMQSPFTILVWLDQLLPGGGRLKPWTSHKLINTWSWECLVLKCNPCLYIL